MPDIFAGNEYVQGGSMINGVSDQMLLFIGLAIAAAYVYRASGGNVRSYLMGMVGMEKSNMADFRKFDAQLGDGRAGAVMYNNSF